MLERRRLEEAILPYFLNHLLTKEIQGRSLGDYHVPFPCILEGVSDTFDLASDQKGIIGGGYKGSRGWNVMEMVFVCFSSSLH